MTTDNNTKPRRRGRPSVADDVRKRPLYVTMPPSLLDWVARTAASRGVSRSRLIAEVLAVERARLNPEESE